jgi:putative flippase GtrA
MLVLAERAGLRIHEVPVDWVDDPDSTVHIVRTAADDLKGVWRIGKALATGSLPLDRLARPFGDDPRDRDIQDVPKGLARQLVGFCVVGALSTLFYLLLYSGFRQFTGAQPANALALLVSAVANTAANRRLTFGVRGPGGAVRHQAQGLVVFAIGLTLTSGSLAALNAATGDPAHSTELAVLIAANLAATVLRFLLFRVWVFPDRREEPPTVAAQHIPTYALPQPPLPQRPLPPVRAGIAADLSRRDAGMHPQPVRPSDHQPGPCRSRPLPRPPGPSGRSCADCGAAGPGTRAGRARPSSVCCLPPRCSTSGI